MKETYRKQVVGYFWLTYAQVVVLFCTAVYHTVTGA